MGYLNEVLTKRSLRDIIALVMKKAGADKAAEFLDAIKNLGYQMAFKGGLSFNLDAVIIPEEKDKLVQEGYERVDEVMESYNMGLITNNERYNQIIDIWTTRQHRRLADTLIEADLGSDKQGFNPVYMMLDSGARGSKDQIRQLSGMRGLMAKPQKSGAEGGQIIENPILAQLQGGSERARVLHLDPWCPQGSCGYRPQDRRRRLSDPPSGRRGPRRHHQRD